MLRMPRTHKIESPEDFIMALERTLENVARTRLARRAKACWPTSKRRRIGPIRSIRRRTTPCGLPDTWRRPTISCSRRLLRKRRSNCPRAIKNYSAWEASRRAIRRSIRRRKRRCELFRDRRQALLAVLDKMSEEDLAKQVPPGGPAFLTDNASMFELLVWHEGLHTGQVSIARRALGHAPLMGSAAEPAKA